MLRKQYVSGSTANWREEQSMESHTLETGTSLKTAEPSPMQRSTTSGFSPTRLARMHDTLLRYVDSGRLPGLVALISRRGAEHLDAIGTLAFDRTAPMRRDTIFRLASVTKPITAVAAMILVEERKLRLDDPVDAFLPAQRMAETAGASWRPPWIHSRLREALAPQCVGDVDAARLYVGHGATVGVDQARHDGHRPAAQ